jgi:ADP-heptose:LPS heptosyltransferase
LIQALLESPQVEFVNLQLDLNEAETRFFQTHPKCENPTANIRDYADTAGLMSQLDLVISVDTSVAHLAGALQKPVWVLLPFHPDWRWLLHRTDSPWYPTARLFRQSKPKSWLNVINAVQAALSTETQKHNSLQSSH